MKSTDGQKPEGTIKIGAQLAVDFLTRGRDIVISNMANAAEGIIGDSRKFEWGDLVCPKCGKKIEKS